MKKIILGILGIGILGGIGWGVYQFNISDNHKENLEIKQTVDLENKKEDKIENKMKNETGNNSEDVLEEQKNKTILILDASGSMWGKINGKSKIEIARKVVADSLENFDNNLDLGLMVYGHRRKKDCSDIELIIEPAANNVTKITEQVNKLQPLGETPMGDAVQQAADYLKYQSEKSTIILVSDGIETCDVDICALGKELEKEGIDFTTHVIGFGLTEKDTIAMKCLAESTGGEFSLATSAGDLEKALGEIVEASSCGTDLPEINITIPEKVEKNTEFKVSWTGVSQLGDMVTLGEIGMKNRNDEISALSPESYASAKAGKLIAPNSVGEYEVVYWAGCGKDLIRKTITIVKNIVTVNFPEKVKVGTRFDISWHGPNTTGDIMMMVPIGSLAVTEKVASFGISAHKKTSKYYMKAPTVAGIYEIIYFTKNKEVLFRKKITINN